MKDKCDRSIIFKFVYIPKTFFGKGLTTAVFILVGNWPDNLEVLMIFMSVGIMSSRHSSRKEVGMGSKAQEISLEFFIVVCNCVIVAG